MRTAIFLWSVLALAQTPPPQDSRNIDIPTTDTHFVPDAFWRHASHGTLAQWESRKQFLRGQILSAAGLDPLPEKTPLHAQVFGRLERGDYTVEKVLLETLPGYYLGGNLYRPVGRSGKFPGVLNPHGHFVHGRLENTIPSSPGYTHLASSPGLGISMARQGYVVFAYDMVGYNDTKQTPHEFGSPRESLWGFGPFGLQLWNSMRSLDFLQTLPDVDPEQIGMTGASGGGTQTFMLAAADDRVKVAAPVNMVSSIMQGGSECENAANLRIDTYNVEIAATIAPRPMILISSPWDQSRHTMTEESVVIRGIYSLFARPANLEAIQIPAQHNYGIGSREAMYRFFGKHFNKEVMAPEKPFTVEKNEDLLALHDRNLPPGALDYPGVFREWRELAARQTEQTRDLALLRRRLKYSLAAEIPEQLLQEIDGDNIVISRDARKDRVPGLWHPGKGAPLLLVHPDGAGAARRTTYAGTAIAAGRPVLLIDAFQTASAVASRDRSDHFFLTFNKSDDANRVQDILTSLAFLQQQSQQKIEIRGIGKAGVWCLFAAAAAGGDLKLEADLAGFQGTDDDFLKQFFVPDIQRAGGMDAALRLTAAMR